LFDGRPFQENRWDVDGSSECLLPSSQGPVSGPYRLALRSHVAVDRLQPGGYELHRTACLEFAPNAGFWFVAEFAGAEARQEWEPRVVAAVRLLADSGFGGRRSIGWGHADVVEILSGSLAELVLGTRPPPEAPPLPPPQPAPVVEPEPEPQAETAAVIAPPGVEPLTLSPIPPEPPPAEPSPTEPPEPSAIAPPPVAAASVEASPVEPSPAETSTIEPAGLELPPLDQLPVEPGLVEPSTPEPSPGEPSPEEPSPFEPAPIEPAPVEPAPVEPAPAVPEPTQPEPALPEPAPEPLQPVAPPPTVLEAAPDSGGAAATAPAVAAALPTPTPTAWWLISVYTPAAEDAVEWSRGAYSLIARSGRVDSPHGSGQAKKTLRMVEEGSLLFAPSAPRGGATDVAPDGFPHPVFRAGYAVALPVPFRGHA
jgi:hypothetical protein